MQSHEVDVAIIGAGTAGLTARRAAVANGARRVVMIEGGPYGTTCARVGCMPSKLLIAAAEAAHGIEHAEQFGVRAHGGAEIDGPAVMARVQRERDRFVGFVLRGVAEIPEEQKIRGWARFIGPTTLEVDQTHRVEAKSVVIAAGTAPFIPEGFSNLGDRLLTNDTVFELGDLPSSVAIVGAGVIALELGQALHRLGVRTAMFNRSLRVGPLQDLHLQGLSREILGAELDLHLKVSDMRAEVEGAGARMSWTDGKGEACSEEFQYVLLAAGRRPNFERLNMQVTGAARDSRGRVEFDHRTMQVHGGEGRLPIFIAGDINGERQLLHEAADEGRIAGSNAAHYPHVEARVRRTPLAIVFTDPNIATVGQSVTELDPKTHAFGEVDYSDQGRARAMGQNRGAVRIWGKVECGTIVAAELIGPRAEHTAHLLAWAIQQGVNVDEALKMPFYHPVIEEGIRTALRELARAIQHHERGRLDCTPGR